MISSHPHIEKPHDDTVIWRYIDLEKFISLLHTRSLFLCRLDDFKDQWEGSWPKPIVEALKTNWQAGPADHFLQVSSRLRCTHYVSCWHASPSESAALWDLYSGRSGVAIRSTVRSLIASISDTKDYYLGWVKYIDFDKYDVPELNMLVPPFYKRKSFEHEREIRVLHWDVPGGRSEDIPRDAAKNHRLSIDPSVMVEQLYISPASPEWLVSAIGEVCRRFGLSAPVTKSELYDPRVY